MSYTCACPTYRISNDYTLALTLVLLEQGAGLGPLALVPRVFLPLRIPQATQQSSQFYPAVTKKQIKKNVLRCVSETETSLVIN